MNQLIFGVLISIIAYGMGVYLFNKTRFPLLHPLLTANVLIIFFLLTAGIPYEVYEPGGQLISFFLAPATVVLAVPLYNQFDLLKRHLFPILLGVIVGACTALLSVFALCKLLGLNKEMLVSLLPKSITTPMGLSISASTGGLVSITMIAILFTGVFGVIICPYIFKWAKIKNSVAKGISLGAASHALGTSKALEIGEVEAAMSGLAISLVGIITVVIISLIAGGL